MAGFLLLLSACSAHGQVKFVPLSLASKPGAAAPQSCVDAFKLVQPLIAKYPHPSQWTFILACSERDWEEFTRHAGFQHQGMTTFALTDRKTHTTYFRVPTLLNPVAVDYGPEHVVAHELGHIMLDTADEDRAERQAQLWMKGSTTVQVAGVQ